MPSSDPDNLVIVEDDDALRASLTWAFELEGYDVQAFADGESLLAEPVMPGRGCLVLDHRLPGIDGLELLRRLRARGVDLPAVLITTPTPAVAREAEQARARLVEKPLVGSGLVSAVWSLTHGGAAPAV